MSYYSNHVLPEVLDQDCDDVWLCNHPDWQATAEDRLTAVVDHDLGAHVWPADEELDEVLC